MYREMMGVSGTSRSPADRGEGIPGRGQRWGKDPKRSRSRKVGERGHVGAAGEGVGDGAPSAWWPAWCRRLRHPDLNLEAAFSRRREGRGCHSSWHVEICASEAGGATPRVPRTALCHKRPHAMMPFLWSSRTVETSRMTGPGATVTSEGRHLVPGGHDQRCRWRYAGDGAREVSQRRALPLRGQEGPWWKAVLQATGRTGWGG